MKADLDELHERFSRLDRIPSHMDYGMVLDAFMEHYAKGGLNLKDFLNRVERHLLLRSLARFDGSQKKASEFLALKPTTLNAKCKKFRIKFVKHPSYPASEE